MGRVRSAMLLASALVAVPAAAQVSRPSKEVHHMKLELSDLQPLPIPMPSPNASPGAGPSPATLSPPAMLTMHLTDGNLEKLAAYAVELLKTAAAEDKVAKEKLGPIEKNHYGIVWIGERDGKEQILRVMIDAADPPGVVARLPGVRLARDVFFSSIEGARLHSVYTSTRVADPVSALIPDALQRWNVVGFLARSLGSTKDAADAVFLQINHTELPFERAAIAIHDTAVVRKDLTQFVSEVADLKKSVCYREARLSPCAQHLADELTTVINDTAKACATKVDPCAVRMLDARDAATKEQYAAECSALLSACVKQMLEAEEQKYIAVVFTCYTASEITSPDPVPIVENRFRELVKAAGAKSFIGDSTLPNTPPTRVALGLVTALRMGETTLEQERVAVQDGKIASVPFDRAMTMVTVNYHPLGFDPAAPGMSFGERFRLFAAGVIAPDFGLAAGVGFGLVKGVAFNGGVALLLADTLRETERIGEAPTRKDPFRTRGAWTVFVGLGFAFK